jgi:hypothetical protein
MSIGARHGLPLRGELDNVTFYEHLSFKKVVEVVRLAEVFDNLPLQLVDLRL